MPHAYRWVPAKHLQNYYIWDVIWYSKHMRFYARVIKVADTSIL